MINIQSNYFEIVLHEDSYHILENQHKPQKSGSSLANLQKISQILTNNLHYHSNESDSYSSLSQNELAKILLKKAADLKTGYKAKIARLDWVTKLICITILGCHATNKTEIKTLFTKISNQIAPPSALPLLTGDCIQRITNYLTLRDLASFARVNKNATLHKNKAILIRSQQLGFVGTSMLLAENYLKAKIPPRPKPSEPTSVYKNNRPSTTIHWAPGFSHLEIARRHMGMTGVFIP